MAAIAHELDPNRRVNHFSRQMHAYDEWRQALLSTLSDTRQWLDQHKLSSAELDLRIHENCESLKSDKLTIAFAAEFSRGKSELINAIFFADYPRRLLPSDVGRTTMCTTELFYDHVLGSTYIQLLPIETRRQDLSIEEYTHNRDYWHIIDLDIDSPDQMADALQEVVKVKTVSIDEAKSLGLPIEDDCINDGTIEIPVWRHARISFPHPLLKQGLAILDTPGLNALGTEPELTVSMLPKAEAVLFVLAADTGVTRSDLEMWREHIAGYRKNGCDGLIAALNKIDTLWDEMKSPAQIAKAIASQRKATAHALGIDESRVLPVSAQKALLAKVKQDQALLEASQITELEDYLANKILPSKQRIVWQKIVNDTGSILDDVAGAKHTQINYLTSQQQQMHALSHKNTELSNQVAQKIQTTKENYHSCTTYSEMSKTKLNHQAKLVRDTINLEAIDYTVARTRKEMSSALTTIGLRQQIGVFFDSVRDTMQVGANQSDQMVEDFEAVYKRMKKDYGLPDIKLKPLNMVKHRTHLDKLYLQGTQWRDSTDLTMTEQSLVIKKFFISMVSHVRGLFYNAREDIDKWTQESLRPITMHVDEMRQNMERHIEIFSKISDSRTSMRDKLSCLEEKQSAAEKMVAELLKLKTRLTEADPSVVS
ncbi:dynamin family protein [Gammaproteobacteria bacterium AH-315-C21]|nr:dynamin family protein [Gammaproteobacteria bacterium AH-315-C21]